jgi:hypothetical protein
LTVRHRYIQKFYQMRTQLQAISLRIQTVRSNEQMMQSMKGATVLLGSMNRQMNLPALQRIAMEFEKENDIMDQRQEMMDDAIDDVTGLEDEEESEEVVNQVLDEIGVDLGQAVGSSETTSRICVVLMMLCSSGRRHLACRVRLFQKDGLRRPSVAAMLGMTTSRLVLIVCASRPRSFLFPFRGLDTFYDTISKRGAPPTSSQINDWMCLERFLMTIRCSRDICTVTQQAWLACSKA